MLINIAYLYPDLMNIYGDRGNLLCFVKRCQWRGIKTTVTKITLNGKINNYQYDFYFGGGGQDKEQILVSKDLQKRKNVLKFEAERNVPMLLICGSYQLFGHYFKTFDHKKLPGISILDCITVASKIRKIGNVIVDPENHKFPFLIGFENHSGNTFITKIKSQKSKVKTLPLGKIIKGYGNNGQDKTEGAIYKNVIGTYLHGPILPKNPDLTDYLIEKALKIKYQKEIKIKPLDDKIENLSREACLKRFLPLKQKLVFPCKFC